MVQVSFTVDRRIYKLIVNTVSFQDALRVIRQQLKGVEGLVIVKVIHE